MTEPRKPATMPDDAGVAPGADATPDAGGDAVSPRVSASVSPAASAAVPLSVASRASVALRHHARGLWLDPGRLLHSLYHGRPGSMAMHIAGTKSLGWVPPDMTGKPRTFLAVAGIAYRLTIGLLLKNLGNGISAAADSFFVALALIAAVVLLIILL